MKMLIIEDHPFVADATKALFLSLGTLQVEICKNSEEALSALKNGNDWHRIWIDINIPGVRGLSLIRHVAEIGLASRSAVITATDNQQWRIEVESLGFLGYIMKTLSVEDFNHALDAIMRGENYHVKQSIEGKSKQLTARQTQILQLLCDGLCTKLIARELKLTPGSVDNHISNIIGALSAKDRINAVLIGIKCGYIDQSI